MAVCLRGSTSAGPFFVALRRTELARVPSSYRPLTSVGGLISGLQDGQKERRNPFFGVPRKGDPPHPCHQSEYDCAGWSQVQSRGQRVSMAPSRLHGMGLLEMVGPYTFFLMVPFYRETKRKTTMFWGVPFRKAPPFVWLLAPWSKQRPVTQVQQVPSCSHGYEMP